MKVAIVSDSHGAVDRLEVMLGRIQEAGITHVIHAGDFAVYPVVDIFKKFPNLKIYVSRGNCDVNDELVAEIDALPNVKVAEVIQVELEGAKIAASHYEGIAQNALKDQGINVFCHGHTHRAKIEERDGFLILNPGALIEDGRYFLLSLPELKVEQKVFNEDLV